MNEGLVERVELLDGIALLQRSPVGWHRYQHLVSQGSVGIGIKEDSRKNFIVASMVPGGAAQRAGTLCVIFFKCKFIRSSPLINKHHCCMLHSRKNAGCSIDSVRGMRPLCACGSGHFPMQSQLQVRLHAHHARRIQILRFRLLQPVWRHGLCGG